LWANIYGIRLFPVGHSRGRRALLDCGNPRSGSARISCPDCLSEHLTVDDIKTNCELLKAKNVKLVGLSGHDSSDGSIEIFKQVFPDSYVNIKVGEKISLGN